MALATLLDEEARQLWIAEWSDHPQFENLFANPFGLTDKPSSLPPFRVTDDLSRLNPLGFCVNDCITQTKDVYVRFDDVVGKFLRVGPRGWLVKADFAHAYRQIFIRALDLHICGFFVPGRGFSFRTRLGFGCRSSGHIWERPVACFRALVGAASAGRFDDFDHWVDDLFRACDSKEVALELLKLLVLVAWLFGFELSMPKVEAGTALDFTGWLFDCSHCRSQ